jgi:archaemetzincin
MQIEADKPAVVLIPIGDVAANLLHSLVAPLGATFGLPCQVIAPIPILPAAYDRQRGQYVGSHILSALARLDLPHAERALGVVDADCYAPGLNFIFGQASIHDRDCFIALPRLRQSFYGLPEDEPLFRERVLKEAVHELGHTYGLRHCRDPRCVMHFSNSLHDTDVKGAGFCPRCRAQVRQGTKDRGRMNE